LSNSAIKLTKLQGTESSNRKPITLKYSPHQSNEAKPTKVVADTYHIRSGHHHHHQKNNSKAYGQTLEPTW
jgi:quinol monooxygenase YgiN